MSETTHQSGGTTIKDSGERREFSTGAHRDCGDGKGAFNLIPYFAILAIAQVFEVGGKKYTANNWRLGMPLSQYVNSALRHSFKASQGWTDEPHPAQAAWNWICFIETQAMIAAGHLPAELNDIQDWLSKDGVTKALADIKVENDAKIASKKQASGPVIGFAVTDGKPLVELNIADHSNPNCVSFDEGSGGSPVSRSPEQIVSTTPIVSWALGGYSGPTYDGTTGKFVERTYVSPPAYAVEGDHQVQHPGEYEHR